MIIDYAVFFSVFGGLYYFDNRKKYVLDNGQRDNTLLKSDLIKIISSLGIGEVVYTIVRWTIYNTISYKLTMNHTWHQSSHNQSH